MPINVAMQEPRARIVSHETDRYVVPNIPSGHYIAPYGVDVVVLIAPCTANDIKGVSVQMEWVLQCRKSQRSVGR